MEGGDGGGEKGDSGVEDGGREGEGGEGDGGDDKGERDGEGEGERGKVSNGMMEDGATDQTGELALCTVQYIACITII